MQDDTDASGQNEDVHNSDTETSSKQSGVSRRTVLKGMYAAPAIMAVGSLPSFASGTSPAGDHGDEDGKEDHDKWDDLYDKWDDDQDHDYRDHDKWWDHDDRDHDKDKNHHKDKDWKDDWWGGHWWW